MTVLTDIYRCSKREDLYLYVPKDTELSSLPEALLQSLGKAEFAMRILLTEDKKLARVNVADVLNGLASKGYFLQMPPTVFGA